MFIFLYAIKRIFETTRTIVILHLKRREHNLFISVRGLTFLKDVQHAQRRAFLCSIQILKNKRKQPSKLSESSIGHLDFLHIPYNCTRCVPPKISHLKVYINYKFKLIYFRPDADDRPSHLMVFKACDHPTLGLLQKIFSVAVSLFGIQRASASTRRFSCCVKELHSSPFFIMSSMKFLWYDSYILLQRSFGI